MRKEICIAILVCLFSGVYAGNQDMLQESIRNYVESKVENKRYQIDNELLYSSKLLPRFYLNRYFEPAWFSNNLINKHGIAMIDAIESIHLEGLEPTDYHYKLITHYFNRITQGKSEGNIDKMKLEILFTDAFMLMSSHLYFGKVNPDEIAADWNIQRKEPELRIDNRLQQAIEQGSISAELAKLSPVIHHYQQLKKELSFYNSLRNESWIEIPFEKTLKPGETSPLIASIRARMMQLGFINDSLKSTYYDENLELQIIKYQRRNGLTPDGVIGRKTINALNTPPQERINTISVNLERIRWLPQQFPERYILVNIANAELDVIQGKDTLLGMRVIVGKNYRKTPVFSGRMTYLVFSPSWTIPPGIMRKDVIPELKKGPEYLQKKHMSILSADGTEVAYNSIDWSKVSVVNFPYIVRQKPGPDNALGKVKFMFPNQYHVYIHDTPSRGLFVQEERALSSGCIRAEKPFELAQLLLSSSSAWTAEKINTAMNRDTEQTVILPEPIQVVIVYFTAWSNYNNSANFRPDIYLRDDDVLNALKQKPVEFIVR